MHKFKLTVFDGLREAELVARVDAVRVYSEDGEWVELEPRKSDGKIIIGAKSRLLVYPEAVNCARVASEPS